MICTRTQIYLTVKSEAAALRTTWLAVAVNKLQPSVYITVQLYCLCVEKFAFWLVIYIKHSIHFTMKHQIFNKTRS